MTTAELAAQLIGAAGILVFIIMYHFKNMKSVLKVKMVMDILWATHYLLLGAASAFATNSICFVRELVFMNNDKRFFKSKVWLWIFVGFNIVSAALTWKGYYSIFPAIASSMATFSFWQKSVKTARVIGVTNNILMFTYDVFVGSYMGIIGEALAFASVLIAMYKSKR